MAGASLPARARGRSDSEILVLNGTREGLFLAAIAAKRFVGARAGRPAILLPNPFYAAYAAGAAAAECETVYLPATRETGFLPDLDAIDDSLLARTVAFYLASPANPQGAVADLCLSDAAFRARPALRLPGLFRRVLFRDLSPRSLAHGMLAATNGDFSNVLVFQSLSKRSNLPGLRVGFVAGDRRFIQKFLDLRNVAAPQVPVPAQEVGAAAYCDEAHVDDNRRLYALKFDLADQIIGGRYGYQRPPGGFFLWLDVASHGGSEAATVKLWRDGGVRVLPGRYLAREQADGSNPGADYIRVAMVHDQETTADALHRIVAVLG